MSAEMFTVYFPHRGSLPTAQCLSDDDLVEQQEVVQYVLSALRYGGNQSKLLAYRMFAHYDMFLLLHLWQLVCETGRRGLPPQPRRLDNNPYLQWRHRFLSEGISTTPRTPRWYGWTPLIEASRSALIRKNPAHYGHQFPTTALDMPYLWPLNVEGHFEFTVRVSEAERRLMASGARVIPPELVTNSKHLKEFAW